MSDQTDCWFSVESHSWAEGIGEQWHWNIWTSPSMQHNTQHVLSTDVTPIDRCDGSPLCLKHRPTCTMLWLTGPAAAMQQTDGDICEPRIRKICEGRLNSL